MKKCLGPILIFCLVFSLYPMALFGQKVKNNQGSGTPEDPFIVPKTEAEITLDGILDEKVWQVGYRNVEGGVNYTWNAPPDTWWALLRAGAEVNYFEDENGNLLSKQASAWAYFSFLGELSRFNILYNPAEDIYAFHKIFFGYHKRRQHPGHVAVVTSHFNHHPALMPVLTDHLCVL